MSVRWRYGLVVCLIAVAVFSNLKAAAQGLLETPDQGVSDLEWHVDASELRVTQLSGDDGDRYSVATVVAWPLTSTPAYPQVPYTTTLVVLPPAATVDVTYEVSSRSAMAIPLPLQPAPFPILQNAASPALGAGTQLVLNTSIYASDAWFPADPVVFEDLGYVRGVHLGRLTAYPVLYNPMQQSLDVIGEISVTLSVREDPVALRKPDSMIIENMEPLVTALAPMVLNPEALLLGPSVDVRNSALTRTSSATALPVAEDVQFVVHQPGIYTLSWAQLRDAGIVANGDDPDRVQLQRLTTGDQVAMMWQADAARFLFYAAPVPTRWADFEVFRLHYGDEMGPRIAERPCYAGALAAGEARSTVVVGEDQAYNSLYVSSEDDSPWFWECLQTPAGIPCVATSTYQIRLDDPQSSSNARLKIWFQGYTRTDHIIDIAVNGNAVTTARWTGKSAHVEDVHFPATYLQPGDNAVTFTRAVSPEGGAWLDYFSIEYAVDAATGATLQFSGAEDPSQYEIAGLDASTEVYDVTNVASPVSLTGCPWSGDLLSLSDAGAGGRDYLAIEASGIRTVDEFSPVHLYADVAGADYIAIAPDVFMSALQPLIAYREQEGLSVAAFSVEQIYDAFGDGRPDPEAIREFVSHAYATWSPRPSYLLLVGDGTWDPKDHLETGSPTWLPPYLAATDPWMKEIPADNRYVAVDGDDFLPDIAVGRLPVNSVAELTATIQKILAYEADSMDRDWKLNHLFVVDDFDGVNDFASSAQSAAQWVPVTHTVSTLQMPSSATVDLGTSRTDFFAAWDKGSLIVNWIGHSSWQQWEHRRLFHTDDLLDLKKHNRLPFVVEMTCFTSNFAHPDPLQTSMDEALIRLPGAGAVATWGSSGGGLDSDHQILHATLYRLLFDQPGSMRLGDAVTLAKLSLSSDSAHLVDAFHLFGDPALSLHQSAVPDHMYIYLPVIMH